MSRAKWKGPYVDPILLKDDKGINITTRSSEILPIFIGKTFRVHNGYKYIELQITDKMVGHKFGEFSPSRKKFLFKKKK